MDKFYLFAQKANGPEQELSKNTSIILYKRLKLTRKKSKIFI